MLYKLLRVVIIVINPPEGSKWISVGHYVENSFTALGSSDPREVRLELQLGFYVSNLLFVQVHFVFCSLNFIALFTCLTKYYLIMFINIVTPRGVVDGLQVYIS